MARSQRKEQKNKEYCERQFLLREKEMEIGRADGPSGDRTNKRKRKSVKTL